MGNRVDLRSSIQSEIEINRVSKVVSKLSKHSIERIELI
jgi:hypothetical protein